MTLSRARSLARPTVLLYPGSLPLHYIVNPPSAKIARKLTEDQANVCEHGKNPCYLLCGVSGARKYSPKHGEIRIYWKVVDAETRMMIWKAQMKS